MKNVKREYKDPYFFFKAGLEVNPVKCTRGKKNPTACFTQAEFLYESFFFYPSLFF